MAVLRGPWVQRRGPVTWSLHLTFTCHTFLNWVFNEVPRKPLASQLSSDSGDKNNPAVGVPSY